MSSGWGQRGSEHPAPDRMSPEGSTVVCPVGGSLARVDGQPLEACLPCRGGLAEQLLGQEEPPARREGAPCLVRGVCRVAAGEAAQLPGAAWRPGLSQWCLGTAPLGQARLMPRPPGLLPVAGRWWSSRVAECGRVSGKVHAVRPRSASTQAGSESFSESGLRLAAALLEAVPGARHQHRPSSGPGPSCSRSHRRSGSPTPGPVAGGAPWPGAWAGGAWQMGKRALPRRGTSSERRRPTRATEHGAASGRGEGV